MFGPALSVSRRRGGGGWSPAFLFAAGAQGLWVDPSDISTGFQDSAATTPQTASGQATGKRLDKSGRGNHLLQATTTARPIYTVASGISSDLTDGVDDALATGAFAAATLTASMDVFIAVKRTDASQDVLLYDVSASRWLAAMRTGVLSKCDGGSGAAQTYWVDGVQVAGGVSTSEDQLHLAVTPAAWHVLEIRGADMSAWLSMKFGNFPGYVFGGDYGGIIVCPSLTDANRALVRRWLGAKVGLSL